MALSNSTPSPLSGVVQNACTTVTVSLLPASQYTSAPRWFTTTKRTGSMAKVRARSKGACKTVQTRCGESKSLRCARKRATYQTHRRPFGYWFFNGKDQRIAFMLLSLSLLFSSARMKCRYLATSWSSSCKGNSLTIDEEFDRRVCFKLKAPLQAYALSTSRD